MNKKYIGLIIYTVTIFHALVGMEATESKPCFIKTPLYPMQEESPSLSNLLISDGGGQYKKILPTGTIEHGSRNISVIKENKETISCNLYTSTVDSSFGIYVNGDPLQPVTVKLTHAQIEQLKNDHTRARYNSIIVDDGKNIYDIERTNNIQASLSNQIDKMNQQIIGLYSILHKTLEIAQALAQKKHELESAPRETLAVDITEELQTIESLTQENNSLRLQQIDLSQQCLNLQKQKQDLLKQYQELGLQSQDSVEEKQRLITEKNTMLNRQKYLIGITTTSMLALMVIIARYLL